MTMTTREIAGGGKIEAAGSGSNLIFQISDSKFPLNSRQNHEDETIEMEEEENVKIWCY